MVSVGKERKKTMERLVGVVIGQKKFGGVWLGSFRFGLIGCAGSAKGMKRHGRHGGLFFTSESHTDFGWRFDSLDFGAWF